MHEKKRMMNPCWALMFCIFKLRFPPGISIATNGLRINHHALPFPSKLFSPFYYETTFIGLAIFIDI
jgi:hypothetical protein